MAYQTVHTTQFDLSYYVKAGIAGGLCASITHVAVCPIDVVK